MEKKPIDIITIGEGLIELSTNASLMASETFSKYYGGDTLCSAVTALRMGSSVSYITKVGNDCFGEYLLDAWQLEGLDTSQIKLANGQNGVYFISAKDKDRIQYYRKKTAATQLSIDDIDFNYIDKAKMIYATGFVQSLSLGCDEVIHNIFEYSKRNEIINAYDPNFSPEIWSEIEAKEAFERICEFVDIIFLNTSCDAQALFSTSSVDEIIRKLSDIAIKTIVIRENQVGTHVVHNGDRHFVPCAKKREVIDATGYDAAFNGAFLHSLLEGSSPLIAAKFANAVTMLQIQKVGAIKSIPNRASVNNLFKEIYG